MKVVVVGGTGFLGRHIVDALTRAGHEVVVLARDPKRAATIPQLAPVSVVVGDVTDAASLQRKFDGADAVVYAVGFPNYPMELPRRGLTFHRYEVHGTHHVVAEAKRAGVGRFLYVSGAGASPASDKSWYRAKGLAEEVIARSGLAYLFLRPSWAYGPEDRALNRFAQIARVSPVIPVPAGRQPQRIQPVYVDDIAEIARRAFEVEDAWNRVLEVGSRQVLTMQEVVRTMLHVMRKRRLVMTVPVKLLQVATLPLVLLPKPPMTPSGIDFATQSGLVDIGDLERVLGITPRPLVDGLSSYLAA